MLRNRAAVKSPLHTCGSIAIRFEAMPIALTSGPGGMILTAPAASSERHTAVKLDSAGGLSATTKRASTRRALLRKSVASRTSSIAVGPAGCGPKLGGDTVGGGAAD